MRERSLKRRTAFILAVLLTFMNCFSVFASETGDDIGEPEITEQNSTYKTDDVGMGESSNGDDTSEGGSAASDNDTDDLYFTTEALDNPAEESDDDGSSDDRDVSNSDNFVNRIDSKSKRIVSDDSTDNEDSSNILRSNMTVSRSLRLGSSSLQLLGATNDEVLAGAWNEFGGILWQLSGNTLTLSANDNHDAPGYMQNLNADPGASAGTTAWLPYAEYIKQVNFKSSPNGEKVKNIGDFAFSGCKNLASFTVYEHITDVGYGAFVGCSELSTIGVHNNDRFMFVKDTGILYQIENDGTCELLFCPQKRTGTTKISENTVKIGDYAFYGCSGLKNTIQIPASVREIGQFAFYGCSGIDGIKIGKRSYNKVKDNADYTGNQITTIGDNAFARCTHMSKFYIPDTIETLPYNAFTEDANLRYFVFYATTDDDTYVDKYNNANIGSIISELNNSHTIPEKAIQDIMVPYNNCVVFFDKNDSTVVQLLKPAVVECGKKLDADSFPDVVYDSNHRFNGWWNSTIGGTRYDCETPAPPAIVGDMDPLYAHWVEVIYVTFDLNGGDIDGDKSNIVVSSDKATYFNEWPEKSPSVDGITDAFVGWYDYANSHITYVEDASSANPTYAPQAMSYSDQNNKNYFLSSRTLRAVYIPRVTINFYSPSLNEAIHSIIVPVGERLDEDEVDDIRNDYRLAVYENDPTYKWRGWYTKGGSQLTITNDINNESPTSYYATYDRYATVNYYNINNDGSNVPDDVDEVKIPKDKYSVKASPHLSGYQFQGWYEFPNGGGTKYSGTMKINDRKTEYNLYAYWLPIYKVTTNDQKTRIGADNDTENTYDVVSGSSIYSYGRIPKDNIDDGVNWAFAGWYTEKEGAGELVDRSYAISENMTVYADWSEGLRVTYYVDSAGAEYDAYIAQYDSSLVLPTLPTQEWADHNGYMGYDCVGWYTKDGIQATSNIKVTKDLEFFGKWVDNPDRENEPHYIVSFNSMGGPEVPSQRVAENTLLSVPDTGVWADHKFIGWYKDKDFREEWDFYNDTVTEDGWLYAKWIDWTEEDEDNAHGIYWVRMLRGGKAPLTEYFKESGLQFSYDKNVVKILQKGRTVKGKRVGETLITATKGDGSEYPVKVRAFVFKQELQDMYAFNTSTTLNAPDFLTVSGFLPDRWESTKTSVASVDPKTGLITVRGRGRSKIKAYYQNKAVTATLYCEVPKFAKKFYRFKTGQSKKIKIKKVKKSDIVSWNIVTVSGGSSGGKGGISGNGVGFAEVDNNGVVTAVSAGEVTLQATVYGQTITTKLHIEPPTLKKNQLEIDINKVKKLKLSRTKLKYVEWKSSNANVAYVDPSTGKVYALKAGRATLKTTAGGVTNTCNVIVTDPGATGTSLGKTANSTLKS